MSSHTPSNNNGIGQFKTTVRLLVVGNLSISFGLLPGLSLSVNGQAALLETNPAPDIPTFDIPTEVEAAPVPSELIPSYEEPKAYAPSVPINEPAPDVVPAPAEPYVEVVPAEPYVEPAPTYIPPAVPQPDIIAQPEVTPLPAQGCAALLDLSIAADTGCAPSLPEPETATPVIPRQNENVFTAKEPLTPPARQVKPTVASSIPPARQLSTAWSPVPKSQPRTPIIPNYQAWVAPAPRQSPARTPELRANLPLGNPSTTSAPQFSSSSKQNFTVVNPDQYSLKPLGKTPLQWVLGDRNMLFPLPFPVAVSSAFGWRQHPIQKSWHLHSGIDFAAAMGTPVVAAYDGAVEIANYVGGYGLSVLLSHQKGERQTRYAHLSEIYVKPGQKIQQGDVIGAVGSTGNSTGPHLHFETLVKTPNGMVIADPSEEVKIALVKALEQMQRRAKKNLVSTPPSSQVQDQASSQTDIAKSLTRYQANRNLSQPYFTE